LKEKRPLSVFQTLAGGGAGVPGKERSIDRDLEWLSVLEATADYRPELFAFI
jgi:hypothetical protein